jgi:hypothetical protein
VAVAVAALDAAVSALDDQLGPFAAGLASGGLDGFGLGRVQ